MFYFVPVKGVAYDLLARLSKGSINILDTEDNKVERMSIPVLYSSNISFQNAVRHPDGCSFKIDISCRVCQRFGSVDTVVVPDSGFKIGSIGYKCIVETLPGNSFVKMSLQVSNRSRMIRVLERRIPDVQFNINFLSCVVHFSNYYIVPYEMTGWTMSESYQAIVYFVFDSNFKFIGNHLISGFQLVKLLNPIKNKALASKLSFAESKIYF